MINSTLCPPSHCHSFTFSIPKHDTLAAVARTRLQSSLSGGNKNGNYQNLLQPEPDTDLDPSQSTTYIDTAVDSKRNMSTSAELVFHGVTLTIYTPAEKDRSYYLKKLKERRERAQPPRLLPWPLDALWTAALGILVTTILATAATAPFGAFHFQTFNPFGLLGNAMALPFVSLCVMPAAVFGVLAYPFGLDWPAWALMGLASEMVLKVAHWVATIDHSTVTIPAFGPAVLLSFVVALLWITLWTTRLRWLGVLPLALGVAFAAKPERPEILIERDGSGIAVRGADGRFVIAGKPSRFVLQQWLTADGDNRSPDDPTLRDGVACDSLGCVARTAEGRTVAYARDRIGIIEDCRRADLVVTAIPWSAPCEATLVHRMDLARDGATSLYRRAEGWSFRASEPGSADRPWTRRRAQAAQPQRPAPAIPARGAADADPAEDGAAIQ